MNRQFINDVGGKFKVALKDDTDRTVAWLLWGDTVRIQDDNGMRAKVRARGREGWVPRSAIDSGDGLLEIYVIDVGQGDGVLMRTPHDDAWHLIDAGVANEKQMTKKGAANFVRWKFLDDLGKRSVTLQNLVLSHPDFDHYGGMLDLLAGKVMRPDRSFAVKVKNFYHTGMGRFADSPRLGATTEGLVADPPHPEHGLSKRGSFITELLGSKASFAQPLRRFDPSFARLAALVAEVPENVRRLSHTDRFLPGYDAGPLTIRILGPVVEPLIAGGAGLRDLGSDSVTRNGHSLVLRVDYDRLRVLLTGDLNAASQRLLLSYHDAAEFAVDVAKGCHHGSDDIDLDFVRAMQARATVISSGDNEDYAHPRPRVLGASAHYGRESRSPKGELLPPLLYSTELARSVRLCDAASVRHADVADWLVDAADAQIKAAERGARFEALNRVPIATDLIYGLINVRSDGRRVMCGYMREGGKDFDIQAFEAGD